MLRIVSFGLVALVAIVSFPVAAQQLACNERTEIIRQLDKDYAEKSTAIGLANNGGVVEVMTSKTDGSWTIIITLPDGTSCLIAAGHSWEALPVIEKAGQEL